MEVIEILQTVTEAGFWRPHRPWVVDRWAVLVSEQIHAEEFQARFLAAAYIDEKYGRSENSPEPEPEIIELNELD